MRLDLPVPPLQDQECVKSAPQSHHSGLHLVRFRGSGIRAGPEIMRCRIKSEPFDRFADLAFHGSISAGRNPYMAKELCSSEYSLRHFTKQNLPRVVANFSKSAEYLIRVTVSGWGQQARPSHELQQCLVVHGLVPDRHGERSVPAGRN